MDHERCMGLTRVLPAYDYYHRLLPLALFLSRDFDYWYVDASPGSSCRLNSEQVEPVLVVEAFEELEMRLYLRIRVWHSVSYVHLVAGVLECVVEGQSEVVLVPLGVQTVDFLGVPRSIIFAHSRHVRAPPALAIL